MKQQTTHYKILLEAEVINGRQKCKIWTRLDFCIGLNPWIRLDPLIVSDPMIKYIGLLYCTHLTLDNWNINSKTKL